MKRNKPLIKNYFGLITKNNNNSEKMISNMLETNFKQKSIKDLTATEFMIIKISESNLYELFNDLYNHDDELKAAIETTKITYLETLLDKSERQILDLFNFSYLVDCSCLKDSKKIDLTTFNDFVSKRGGVVLAVMTNQKFYWSYQLFESNSMFKPSFNLLNLFLFVNIDPSFVLEEKSMIHLSII